MKNDILGSGGFTFSDALTFVVATVTFILLFQQAIDVHSVALCRDKDFVEQHLRPLSQILQLTFGKCGHIASCKIRSTER